MRSYCLSCFAAVLFCAMFGNARANLIDDGSFEAPDVGGGYQIFTNGSVPGWTSNHNELEIDYTNILGGPAYAGRQSAELNGNTFDTISQTVSGLTVGAHYALSWAYGSRPGYGPQEAGVTFGDKLITNDFSNGAAGSMDWTLNSFVVSATAPSEVLSFAAIGTPGYNPNGGNEIDAVSLNPVPVSEPASIFMLCTALFGLILIHRKRIK
jgi:hypothetical protein